MTFPPVLLGSLGRIPLGILTDVYGGRIVFIGVMFCSIVPAVLMGWVSAYWQLLACGFLIGIALASFSVGVGFVNGWYPPQRQGAAIGVYGAGNIGQSIAAFAAPLLVGGLGFAWGFWGFAVLTLAWLVVFALYAHGAPRRGAPPVRSAGGLSSSRHPASFVSLSLESPPGRRLIAPSNSGRRMRSGHASPQPDRDRTSGRFQRARNNTDSETRIAWPTQSGKLGPLEAVIDFPIRTPV